MENKESLEKQIIDRWIKIRKKLSITQLELAKKAGLSCSTIQRYESGKTVPDFASLLKIASVLPDATLIELAKLKSEYKQITNSEMRKNLNNMIIQMQLDNNKSEEYAKCLVTISAHLSALNETGMEKAVEAVEILTKVPDYTKR